jgi:nicotinate-nucleotide adenylyltransferase
VKIGIYGGSFNPVHYGHVNVARRAIAELGLDRLIVIPASVSPFKTDTPTIFNRLEMLDDAFSGMEKTVVDRREIERGGVSYAIDTVREIAAENPGAELFFIIGEDSLAGLPRWKNADELSKLCTFKAFERTRESSTEVRARLAAGLPVDDLVPPAVAAFIAADVRYNDDVKTAQAVLSGLVRKGGYCPCRLAKTPEFFCPCDEFKEQLADPEFHGLCHCRLFQKP